MSTLNVKGTALITGASSGIGATYADRFAKRGYDLLLVARDLDRLESLATRLRSETGVKVEVLKADLTDTADLLKVEQRLRGDASISLLLNNAGVAFAGTLAEADLQGVDVNKFPPERVMEVGEMVDAALGPGLSLSSAAARYKAPVA